MCGIAGIVTSRSTPGLSGILRAMAGAIAHRGPDDEGFLEAVASDGAVYVGLAHRRLSIIDLDSGHQPIGSEDGTVQVVFNGEIYNFEELRKELIEKGHSFRTRSDTETIVHAYEEWGDDCVTRFRGMFAFAIWDSRRERLVLARDPFGKKPLYLFEDAGLLLFASEIKAILAFLGVARGVDREAVWDYWAYRYVPGPKTLFAGIRKLMPGSVAVWQRGQLTERRFYLPPDGAARRSDEVTSDPVGSFLAKLEECVRIRMVSDVPFGAFLSGGIDSSAVVALMSRHSSLPIKTFSVGFAESRNNELGYAKTIADHFGTDHHELMINESDLMNYLPRLIRYRDAPVAEPSDIPIFLLSVEARRSVKMVLTGEGSDEILGGYPKHVYERYAHVYQLLPGWMRRNLIERLVRGLPFGFRRAKTAIVNLGLERRCERMPRWFGAMSDAERRQLVAVSESHPGREGAPELQSEPGNSALRAILFFDQTSWLPDNLLERGDRMTMAASLEARMPFVDHELASFVSQLPDHWRVRGLGTKRILREAMRRVLPAPILERPKIGFRVPVEQWFRTTMRDYLFDHLTGPSCRTKDYYHSGALMGILNEHAAGRQNHEKLLWCLLVLEIWHREYKITP